MDRLTIRQEDGGYDLKECQTCTSFNCIFCKHLTKAIKRLGELEDIEHGILIKSRDFKE